MTTEILKKPTIWDIASKLEFIKDHLRITNDMMIDQLGNTVLTDVEGVSITHERLFLLLEFIPIKLAQLDKLHGALMTMHGEGKQQQSDNTVI